MKEQRRPWIRTVTLIVAVLVITGSLQAASAQTSVPSDEIAIRDALIADQEALLNAYRCLFGIDTEVVPGGCSDWLAVGEWKCSSADRTAPADGREYTCTITSQNEILEFITAGTLSLTCGNGEGWPGSLRIEIESASDILGGRDSLDTPAAGHATLPGSWQADGDDGMGSWDVSRWQIVTARILDSAEMISALESGAPVLSVQINASHGWTAIYEFPTAGSEQVIDWLEGHCRQ